MKLRIGEDECAYNEQRLADMDDWQRSYCQECMEVESCEGCGWYAPALLLEVPE